ALALVTPMRLPAPKRWWQLPDGVSATLRAKESFSSLEKMLFNPYHWLLQYPAKLQPSRIVSLGGDFRMLGNLAHGLVEQYFLHPEALSMSATDFDRWYADAFNTLVDQEGAILRTPGRGADLEGFRYRLHQSMRNLREQVAKAGMVQVVPEQAVSGHFPGGELAGSADLVMQNDRGERAIVDMKWSGSKKFPEKLQQNRHLQLAIYGELLRQATGQWPSVAYYVLDKARFFAPDDRVFPDADVAPSANGENTAQLWQRFLATWRWRVAQIQAGQFEVALDGIPVDEASEPPEDAMVMETLNAAYNDYRTLAGWEN
ncbi:MAG: PD-(D/E)XK nuclease family protein, partial [Propionivibrio sp.]|nr:PD-(D/E)XK nuclease family protein [Propionivibrio sp.]